MGSGRERTKAEPGKVDRVSRSRESTICFMPAQELGLHFVKEGMIGLKFGGRGQGYRSGKGTSRADQILKSEPCTPESCQSMSPSRC